MAIVACAHAFQQGTILGPTLKHSQWSLLSSPQSQSTNDDHPLIELAKHVVYNGSGFYSKIDEELLSEEFVFRGPYIGPLNKKDYGATMNYFSVYESIPDISPNAWGFSIDPQDPNRVWFMVRNSGSFTGKPFSINGIDFPASGKALEGCPETFSIIFDEEQKVKHLSVGYVADRFQGNTNGDGAAVGIFRAFGIFFPKPGPLLSFLQWAGTEFVSEPPFSYSKEVPSWWTNPDKASEGYL